MEDWLTDYSLRSRHLEVMGTRKDEAGRTREKREEKGSTCPRGPWKSFLLTFWECRKFLITKLQNDLWLVDWLTNWLYCTGTDQLTEWFLPDWLTNWLYCPKTYQLNKWFMADWLTNWLYCTGTDQLTEWFLPDWLTNWLYCPKTYQLNKWFMADWIVQGLTNWLSD